jgi:hypothetical protein
MLLPSQDNLRSWGMQLDANSVIQQAAITRLADENGARGGGGTVLYTTGAMQT